MNTVIVERDGEIWTVTLNRPEARNAVDGPTARALADAFRAFDADSQARVAVLRGSGEHFCGGADLKAVAGGLEGTLRRSPGAPTWPPTVRWARAGCGSTSP